MKSKFYGYYKPSKETFDALWENALIVLDANILLDFYRLSKSTCDDLFEVLKALKERIWIPYQAASEYHKKNHHLKDKTIPVSKVVRALRYASMMHLRFVVNLADA